MSSFDPHVLFSFPRERVTRSFHVLYGSFQLRKWVSECDSSLYRDEYNELVDFLRLFQPALKKDLGVVRDMVIFLGQLEASQTRTRLRYLFELCCLCLTETATSLPVIKTSFIDTSDYRCKHTEFIQSVHSYLSTVPDGVAVCTSDASLSDFNSLYSVVETSSFETSLYPCQEFDLFSCRKIFKSLMTVISHLILLSLQHLEVGLLELWIVLFLLGKSSEWLLGVAKKPKKRQMSVESTEAGTSKESPAKISSKSSSRRSSVSDNGDSSGSTKL